MAELRHFGRDSSSANMKIQSEGSWELSSKKKNPSKNCDVDAGHCSDGPLDTLHYFDYIDVTFKK